MAVDYPNLSPSMVSRSDSLSPVSFLENAFSETVSLDNSFSLSPLISTRRNNCSLEEGRSEDWKWNQTVCDQPRSSFQLVKERSRFAFVSAFIHTRSQLQLFCQRRDYKRQIFALLLVLIFGVVPFALFLYITKGFSGEDRFFNPETSNYRSTGNLFSKKQKYCQASIGGANANISLSGNGPIQNMFVLDKTFGATYSFANVKLIDMCWDILVGRGAQLLASWSAYVVFTDMLLRVIELHPVSLDAFKVIALEGTGLSSLLVLIREAYALKSKRVYVLFIYMLLSTTYIIALPPLLGGMTGYDTSNAVWLIPGPEALSEGTSNLMMKLTSASDIWVVVAVKGQNLTVKTCESRDFYRALFEAQFAQTEQCNCRYPNGTIHQANTDPAPDDTCVHAYPYQNGNWTTYNGWWPGMTGFCTGTFNVTVEGKIYDASELTVAAGSCFDSVGYTKQDLADHLYCLPDTGQDSYQWGFSSMIAAVFIVMNLIWTLSMYIMWQDAQRNSSLVKNHYNMTPLRAAFVVTEATKQVMGLTVKELICASDKNVTREVYGTRTTKGTVVDYQIFAQQQDGMEMSYRALEKDSDGKQDTGFSEIALA